MYLSVRIPQGMFSTQANKKLDPKSYSTVPKVPGLSTKLYFILCPPFKGAVCLLAIFSEAPTHRSPASLRGGGVGGLYRPAAPPWSLPLLLEICPISPRTHNNHST